MILGIMGGMGPGATCDLFKKITEFTHATRDQEHIHIVIDSNVEIPDRSQYICGTGEDPKIEMIRSITRLEMMGADYIAIPCNTAHYFYDDIIKYTKARVLHMIRETAIALKTMNPQNQDFLLLATEGTYLSGVYKKVFQTFGMHVIEPTQVDKQIVMEWIYKIKAGQFDISLVEFETLINRYMKERKVPIILGCTELPLLVERIGASKRYIDPVSILAKRCVEIGKSSKKELSYK